MSEAITSLFVTEKNRLHSTSPWWILVECPISSTQSIRVVHGPSNFTWNGNVYYAAALAVSSNKSNSEGSLESINLTVSNISGEFRSLIELGNLDDKTVTIRRVHASSGASDVLEYVFQIQNIQMDDETISFVLSHANLLNKPFPANRYFRATCGWVYKSLECGYTGAITECDKTLNGSNGCKVHGIDETYHGCRRKHPERFGGFPSLPEIR